MLSANFKASFNCLIENYKNALNKTIGISFLFVLISFVVSGIIGFVGVYLYEWFFESLFYIESSFSSNIVTRTLDTLHSPIFQKIVSQVFILNLFVSALYLTKNRYRYPTKMVPLKKMYAAINTKNGMAYLAFILVFFIIDFVYFFNYYSYSYDRGILGLLNPTPKHVSVVRCLVGSIIRLITDLSPILAVVYLVASSAGKNTSFKLARHKNSLFVSGIFILVFILIEQLISTYMEPFVIPPLSFLFKVHYIPLLIIVFAGLFISAFLHIGTSTAIAASISFDQNGEIEMDKEESEKDLLLD